MMVREKGLRLAQPEQVDKNENATKKTKAPLSEIAAMNASGCLVTKYLP